MVAGRMGSSSVARIGQRYELHEALGSGGMATTFRASDRLHGGELAVKLVGRDDPALGAALRAEFARLSGLFHPRLVRVRDFGSKRAADGRIIHFYTADLLRGVSLAEFARDHAWSETTGALADACEALAF